VELINKFGIEPILLIRITFAFVCAYLLCTALANNFHKLKLRWHFINWMASNQMKEIGNRGWCDPPWSFLRGGYRFASSNQGKNVDIHSLDDLILEDLMKLWWRYLKILPWNHAYINEVMEIWCYLCWSRLVCMPSIWINHGKNKLGDCYFFIDHLALIRCIGSLLCILICWNIFQRVKWCL